MGEARGWATDTVNWEIVSFDLTGQTGIVTGAATGIGEAIAHRLAGAGATIAQGLVYGYIAARDAAGG